MDADFAAHVDHTIAALGLTPASLARRCELLGYDAPASARLRALAPRAIATAPVFVERLYDRLGACDATCAWLTSPELVARLKRSQRAYLASMLGDPLDWAQARRCVRVGMVHHRVQLPPSWYLATFAHWVADHVDHAFADAPTPAAAVAAVDALLRRTLLEATLVLDAYGISTVEALQRAAAATGLGDGSAAAAAAREGPAAVAVAPPVARLRVDRDEVEQRRAFVELDVAAQATLRAAAPAITAAVPAVVDAFYAWAGAAAETAPLLPPPTIGPLKRQVEAYWHELATATFDRPYAASRSRLGLVHERVGLSLQLYIVGVAHQVGALLARVVPDAADPPALARAMIRALFFDLSFVVDAYLDARAAALLRADGYAAALLAGLPQGVAVVDPTSLWIDSANPALLTMFGLDARLVRGVHVEALVPLSGIAAWLARFAAGHEPRAVAVLAAGPRQFRATAVRLADADAGSRSRIALVLDDLGETSRLRSVVDDLEGGLARLTASVAALVWEADQATGTIQLMAQPVLALTGYRDVHFLGRPGAWLALVPDDERAALAAAWSALRPGERSERIHRLRRADGEVAWVRSDVVAVATDGGPVIRGVTIDVTAAVTAQQAQLAAVGRLAGGVAHECNNRLMVISGALTVVTDAPLDDADRAMVDAAGQAVERSAELTRQLLAFAQRRPLKLEAIGVNDVVLAVARGEADAARIELALSPAPWPCVADRGELVNALRSLLGNARDVLPPGGVVRLTTRNVPQGDVDPRLAARLVDHVEVAVADDGPGMAPDVMRQAFEPFFTTKAAARGMGLSAVYGFVQQCGGHVLLTSADGHGTVVRLRFPRTAAAAPALAAPGVPTRRVLVVDDEPEVRRVLARLLTRERCHVVEVADAAQALALLDATAFDLLVTDVVLGAGLDGVALGREARRRRPGLPVIYVSGYPRDALELAALAAGEWFLPKPVAIADLRATLREALAAIIASA